jgi:hypothetical protein
MDGTAKPQREIVQQPTDSTASPFKYRLLPAKRQHAELRRILEDQRQLYNAALEKSHQLLCQDR